MIIFHVQNLPSLLSVLAMILWDDSPSQVPPTHAPNVQRPKVEAVSALHATPPPVGGSVAVAAVQRDAQCGAVAATTSDATFTFSDQTEFKII